MQEVRHPEWWPDGYQKHIDAEHHSCYDPGKVRMLHGRHILPVGTAHAWSTNVSYTGTKRCLSWAVSPLTVSQDTMPESWRPRCCTAVWTSQAASCGHLQDLVIPNLKHPGELAGHSPLFGRAERERGILLLFRGDVGVQRHSHYSRGIRQKLYSLVGPLESAVAPGVLSTATAAQPLPRHHHSARVRAQVYEAGCAVLLMCISPAGSGAGLERPAPNTDREQGRH